MSVPDCRYLKKGLDKFSKKIKDRKEALNTKLSCHPLMSSGWTMKQTPL
jgi:hypothetical protein